ncbi:uncharacterized protein LOC141856112 isoform X3 [Brevipalpus obovatus]|uniref:uncharacterized protein LOC141856112 isoform X3 n=1 Tax=Brevipalpus obovatus TaxID=246614 RepID=UPI003D9EA58E
MVKQFENSNFPVLDLKDDYPYCPNWQTAHYNLARLGPKYYPIDIYRKFENHRQKKVNLYMKLGGGGFCAVFWAAVVNMVSGRPIYAKAYRYITYPAIVSAFVLGSHYYKVLQTADNETRNILFMEKYPELFPVMTRLKIGDIGKDDFFNIAAYYQGQPTGSPSV